jgi:hypothetical protein
MGSIPASSDTVESERRQMKQCWITYNKIPPLKKFGSISYRLNFFTSFCLFPFVSLQIFSWSSNFSVHFRFTWIFSLHFAYFTFVFASDFCCFASMWNKQNHAFFSLSSETKFLLHFQFSLPKRKRGRTLLRIHPYKIMRIRVRSASQVGKLLTNILLAVKISTRSPSIPFCFSYRMRRLR